MSKVVWIGYDEEVSRGEWPNCAPEINAPTPATANTAGSKYLVIINKDAYLFATSFFGVSSSEVRLPAASKINKQNISISYRKSAFSKLKNKIL